MLHAVNSVLLVTLSVPLGLLPPVCHIHGKSAPLALAGLSGASDGGYSRALWMDSPTRCSVESAVGSGWSGVEAGFVMGMAFHQLAWSVGSFERTLCVTC